MINHQLTTLHQQMIQAIQQSIIMLMPIWLEQYKFKEYNLLMEGNMILKNLASNLLELTQLLTF